MTAWNMLLDTVADDAMFYIVLVWLYIPQDNLKQVIQYIEISRERQLGSFCTHTFGDNNKFTAFIVLLEEAFRGYV